jgi:NAD(P)H dehydrogenase (quinone)
VILVTGASGHLGRRVIDHLLQRVDPGSVAALVRDAQGEKGQALARLGVRVCAGNYDDVASLETSMRDVDQVLLISGTDEANRVRQHGNVVHAAKRAGVGRIAYTSRALRSAGTSENSLMDGHFKTEALIQASGVAYTIFRNALYFEVLPIFLGGGKVFEMGIHLPVGHGRVAFALRAELGEAIARSLHEPPTDSGTLLLTAHRSWSFQDIASTLSDLAGRQVPYVEVDRDTFETTMRRRGLAEAVVQRIYGFYSDIRDGQLDEVTPDLQGLLGRQPSELRAALAAVFPR